MRFLADQDVFGPTIRLLREEGHDVITAFQLGLAQASDIVLLQEAQKLNRLMLTQDRDYGKLVHVHRQGGGVVYLRVENAGEQVAVHDELKHVLSHYTEERLLQTFTVIEPHRHRFRNPPR